MTEVERATIAAASTARPGENPALKWACGVVAEIKRRWSSAGHADALRAFEEHPEILAYRSLALNLAQCEFRLRRTAGEELTTEEFCERFPGMEVSLAAYMWAKGHVDGAQDLQDLGVVSWPQPGEQFLDYELISELGRGAFARVFLARELKLGARSVALKVAVRGDDEANVLGKLDHRNIVPVHSVDWDPDTRLAAICMPFLGRATLSDVLRRAFGEGPIPTRASIILDAIAEANEGLDVEQRQPPSRILRNGSYVNGALFLAAQMAQGVAHSHRSGVCHRDLKPSNVLLSASGMALLLDFNLSVDAPLSGCRVGGTLSYMAPEALAILSQDDADWTAEYDGARADIYSLGVILYQMLAGELPFGEIPSDAPLPELAARLHQQQQQGPAALRRKNPHVDGRLARLVEACLALDPQQRPASADVLARQLASQIKPLARARRWVRVHPGLATATASLLLATVLGAAAFVATRPSYRDRQLQSGRTLSDAGDYAAAIACFNEALRFSPDDVEALFARSRARARAGDFSTALDDLRAAHRIKSDPVFDACLGYCCARMGDDKTAVFYYDMAIDKGLRSMGLLNNLGFSCVQLNRCDEAERFLKQALDVDPNLPSAHHLLLMVHSKKACRREPLPEMAFDHARRATDLGFPSPDLYRLATDVFAVRAKYDSTAAATAIDCLEKAVDLGLDPEILMGHPDYASLREYPRFRALEARPRGTRPSSPMDPLIDPF